MADHLLSDIDVSGLPAVNAALNSLATVLLVIGYVLVRRKRVTAHRNTMIAAFLTSVAFLVCYVIYHYNTVAVTEFRGPRWIKPYYLIMLFSHIVLAMAVPPLSLTTLYFAARGTIDRHRRIARVTLPIWLYVSFTGVLVYLVLYQLFPGGSPR